jgi:hypothetical protein
MKRILVISLFLINCLLIVGFPTVTKANNISNAYAVKTYQKIPSFPLIPFDSTLIAPFFAKYPKLKYLKPEVVQLYKKHNYEFPWYDNGMNEFAALLYDKVNNLEQEGLKIHTLCSRNTSHFSGCGNNGKVRPRSRTYVLSLFFFMLISI